MIQLTPQMRILVGVEAVDFRKGIDGLARACREVLAADPFSGWMSGVAKMPGEIILMASPLALPRPYTLFSEASGSLQARRSWGRP
jgi:hypothetical protein